MRECRRVDNCVKTSNAEEETVEAPHQMSLTPTWLQAASHCLVLRCAANAKGVV